MITAVRARYIVERNALAYRRMWPLFLAGFAEPFLYLLSIGVGVGHLVGKLPAPNGRPVSYEAFVAPAMLATAAMNGAVIDTTFGFFVKFKYLGTYDTMLATPVTIADLTRGEVMWGFLRGAVYSGVFLLAMAGFGLIHSAWVVLALPAALLIGYGFAGIGLAATTWMRSFVDFDYVNLGLVPMFLFSATFFPLSRYSHAVQWIVRVTPLYHGVALERALLLGGVDIATAGHALYLLLMGVAGVAVGTRRLRPLLQP